MRNQAPPTSNSNVGFSSDEQILTSLNQLARRSVRDGHGLFRLEGPKAYFAAQRASWPLKAVVYSRRLVNSPTIRSAISQIDNDDIPVAKVGPSRFRGVSMTTRASGIAAIARQRWTRLNDLQLGQNQWLVVIDAIRSSGNLGTIIRTAEAVGTAAIIFCGHQIDPFAPAVVRASMGGLFEVPLIRSSPQKLRRWLEQHSVQTVGLSPAGTNVWQQRPENAPLLPPTALIIGEERRGVSPQLQALCQTTVSLPQPGEADSLNVAVATGVMLYELLRRATAQGSSLSEHRRSTPAPIH